MKIDSKSLVLGILARIVIASIVSVVLIKSFPSGFTPTKQYTVSMKIRSDAISLGSYVTSNNTRYPNGVVAVFIHNNVTVGSWEIWYSSATNITLQENDYTVKIYEAKSGLYSKTLQIYLSKDIQIEV